LLVISELKIQKISDDSNVNGNEHPLPEKILISYEIPVASHLDYPKLDEPTCLEHK